MSTPLEPSSPWLRLAPERAARLAREAVAEIGPGHELYGHALVAVAACGYCDDVLVRVDDGSCAIVHLTWTAKKPDTPPWPHTERFGVTVAQPPPLAFTEVARLQRLREFPTKGSRPRR
jgi:hypothetical protein